MTVIGSQGLDYCHSPPFNRCGDSMQTVGEDTPHLRYLLLNLMSIVWYLARTFSRGRPRQISGMLGDGEG